MCLSELLGQIRLYSRILDPESKIRMQDVKGTLVERRSFHTKPKHRRIPWSGVQMIGMMTNLDEESLTNLDEESRDHDTEAQPVQIELRRQGI